MKPDELKKEIYNDLKAEYSGRELSIKNIDFILKCLIKEISIDLVSHKKFEVKGLGIIYCKTILPILHKNPITIRTDNEAVKLTKGKNIMFMNLSKEIRDFLKEAGGYGKTKD